MASLEGLALDEALPRNELDNRSFTNHTFATNSHNEFSSYEAMESLSWNFESRAAFRFEPF